MEVEIAVPTGGKAIKPARLIDAGYHCEKAELVPLALAF